ncbi:MAG TPA: hypothetical protein VNZ05_08115 [Solirubrobacteraceae bacterium]|nr:hypothetical protein [Solirubrobacteraceae bacterium]
MHFLNSCKEQLLSFFDDGEETDPRPSGTAARPRPAAERPAGAAGAPPRPRRPASGTLPLDQHTVMVRRRVAAGIGVVLLILIILLINGCLNGEKEQAEKNYNRDVGQIVHESDESVTAPLFAALSGAGSKSALNVEVQVDQLRIQAQSLASRAKSLSVPSEMANAQRYLLETMNFRAEALTKIAALTPTALGGQGKQAITQIAGDMEIFLASDVLYSQRVAPAIQQALSAAGARGIATASSHSLPNIGWLEASTVETRIAGHSATSPTAPVTGNHGSALKEVSVGTNKLEPEPALNHITGGGNPTFTVAAENSGEVEEHNVKVDVTVTAGGKQYKASHVIEKTEPGKTVNVDIPVIGVPLGVAAKIEVFIEGVPGENDLENNKSTYLSIFEK